MEFVYLTTRDIVRHPLVSNIVKAYERDDRRRQPRRPRRRPAPRGAETAPPGQE
jgi:phosphate starvation-inducible protein PhoH